MDFFEVLIILAFILLPLLEGIFKRRRAGREEDVPIEPPSHRERERERVEQGAGPTSARGTSAGGRAPEEPADAGPAADMIPQDLWEVLTGERRSAPASGERSWEDDEEPWVQEPVEEFPDELGAGEGELSPWAREYEDIADVEPESTEPVSPHHPFPKVVSLEGPPPPSDVRHRRFHEKYDGEALPAAPVATDFARELRSALRGQGLRRSVVLAEVLGPPKGLL